MKYKAFYAACCRAAINGFSSPVVNPNWQCITFARLKLKNSHHSTTKICVWLVVTQFNLPCTSNNKWETERLRVVPHFSQGSSGRALTRVEITSHKKTRRKAASLLTGCDFHTRSIPEKNEALLVVYERHHRELCSAILSTWIEIFRLQSHHDKKGLFTQTRAEIKLHVQWNLQEKEKIPLNRLWGVLLIALG